MGDMLLVTRKKKGLSKKKSSLGENWPNPSVRLHSSTPNEAAGMKYVVYRQPLSLDRFFIHEVSPAEAATARLENAFILINLNRFQQIVSVFTLQADSEQLKNNWILKLREAQEMWKTTLQTTVFREIHHLNNNNSSEFNDGQNSTTYSNQGSPPKTS